jgi:hypothetical protein
MSDRPARLAQAVLAGLFCLAAMVVFGQIAANHSWSNFFVRAPIFLLVYWAYNLRPNDRLVITLAALSFASVVGAFLTIVLRLDTHPQVLNLLGVVGAIALGSALAIHAWQVLSRWRTARARRRATTRGPLERQSGGF